MSEKAEKLDEGQIRQLALVKLLSEVTAKPDCEYMSELKERMMLELTRYVFPEDVTKIIEQLNKYQDNSDNFKEWITSFQTSPLFALFNVSYYTGEVGYGTCYSNGHDYTYPLTGIKKFYYSYRLRGLLPFARLEYEINKARQEIDIDPLPFNKGYKELVQQYDVQLRSCREADIEEIAKNYPIIWSTLLAKENDSTGDKK